MAFLRYPKSISTPSIYKPANRTFIGVCEYLLGFAVHSSFRTLRNVCSHTGENIYKTRRSQILRKRWSSCEHEPTKQYRTGRNGARYCSQRWSHQRELCIHYCSFVGVCLGVTVAYVKYYVCSINGFRAK